MTQALRMIARPALLFAGVLLAGLALHALPGAADRAWLARQVMGQGAAGAVLFVALGAVLAACGAPRQAIAFAAGYAFGGSLGVALALPAQVLGCAADFAWARLVARGWVTRRLAGRLGRLHAFLAANPFSTTLMLRMMPVGNNLALNLLAGASGISAPAFIGGSALGYVPQTVVFALLGAGFMVGRGSELAVAAALFLGFGILGATLVLRWRRAQALVPAE